ncbi:MAG TPA: glycosyltransferase [Flavobacterium sp.]|uniref:glycosyltransferase n=1 Tax=Flavobacterium sp. TaxID=239 RepID=UPI002B5571FC|nr:glycosyltransferase [Flavobacterium sp.]HNP33132.1 glycosyltransferase [Flavobacterium sp.]
MHPKKILIVTNGFYPEISPRSFRATELAKELVRQGHEVTVCTHFRSGIEAFAAQNNFRLLDLGSLTWPKPVVKGSGIELLIRRIVSRFSSLLLEYPTIQLIPLIKKALKNEKDYDALISIAVPYPIHWGVAKIWSKKKPVAKTWIADCGDPYMGQENDTFKPPFYFGYLEKKFCRKADFITVPTINSIKGYYPEFHHKIKVIPQGFRFEDITLYNGSLNQDKIIFGYAGMFIPGRRDPSEFLNYLNSLDENLKFEFHLYTTTPQFVTPYVEASRGRIIIQPIVPREKLLYELSKMHFVINFENVGHTQTPSKLIDYLIIDKPVLSVTFGNLQSEIFQDFLKGNYQQKMILPDKDNYRIENVASKFIALIS